HGSVPSQSLLFLPYLGRAANPAAPVLCKPSRFLRCRGVEGSHPSPVSVANLQIVSAGTPPRPCHLPSFRFLRSRTQHSSSVTTTHPLLYWTPDGSETV